MSTNKNKDRFILQAGILASAGLISRVIGILYRSPLTGIIGDEGNGYYSAAYYIYTIILLVSSYSIPAAISKVIAGKLALKDYKNAQKVFHCAVLYVIVVGSIASLFTYFAAGILVTGNSIPVLRVFAPTIFFSGLLGVLRGYFQAHGTMVPTSISQIAEQILNAVISIGAALWFTSLVEGKSDTTRAIYGAAGSALGTGFGVLTALAFMLLIYVLNRKMVKRRVRRDIVHEEESYGTIYKVIICMVTPIILSTFIYNLSTPLNQTIYTRIMEFVKGVEEARIAKMYGIYAGKAVVIANIPIALASAMAAAMIPSIAASFAKGEKKQVRKKVADAIRTTMMISIPAAVGLAVLARPIVQLLFPQKESLEQAAAILQVLSITVIFYALSTLTNAVLQAVEKVNLPVFNAAAALILQTAVLVPMLLYTELNLYALSFCMILYSFLMCLFNGLSVRRAIRYKQEYWKTFIKPFFAAILMGITAWGAYQGIYALLPSNTVALAVSIVVAGFVYFASAMALGAVDEEDLKRLPKGYLIAAFGKKCYLLRCEPLEERERTSPSRKTGKKTGRKTHGSKNDHRRLRKRP